MSAIGFVHVVSAFSALVLGTLVIISRKGSKPHRILGYNYFFSMLVLNGSALMIYKLFGFFGPFHYAAVISLATIVMGIIPVWKKAPSMRGIYRHMAFMYFSVVGLYSALASEIATRLFHAGFFAVVLGASLLVTFIGVLIYIRYYKQWLRLI